MENPTLGIRCRIVARISTEIHQFNGNSHKIRSDSYRIRVDSVVGLNLLGMSCSSMLMINLYLLIKSMPNIQLAHNSLTTYDLMEVNISPIIIDKFNVPRTEREV